MPRRLSQPASVVRVELRRSRQGWREPLLLFPAQAPRAQKRPALSGRGQGIPSRKPSPDPTGGLTRASGGPGGRRRPPPASLPGDWWEPSGRRGGSCRLESQAHARLALGPRAPLRSAGAQPSSGAQALQAQPRLSSRESLAKPSERRGGRAGGGPGSPRRCSPGRP